MRIGFDLDGVFVDKPPFVPKNVIEWLYRERANHVLSYRIPSRFEQMVRKISHRSIFRPPIKKNIAHIKTHRGKNKHMYYLISGRFGFLQRETAVLLKKYKLNDMFEQIHTNIENQQPHIFKQKVLKKLHIDVYVDDDLPLIKFLAAKHRHIRFFWFNEAPRSKAARYQSGIPPKPTPLRQGYGGVPLAPSSSKQALRYSAKGNKKEKRVRGKNIVSITSLLEVFNR